MYCRVHEIRTEIELKWHMQVTRELETKSKQTDHEDWKEVTTCMESRNLGKPGTQKILFYNIEKYKDCSQDEIYRK